MTKIETDEYFRFLCSIIDDQDFHPSQYQLLLSRLDQEIFTWTLEDDENRAKDGLGLRKEFGELIGADTTTYSLDHQYPCSVLEMMVALARRCELQIMEDPFSGSRIGRWFKAMIKSLGLKYETDDVYDEDYVDYIISSFLNREYERNGDGGLFKVKNTDKDLREMEIWYQMNLYLCSLESW